MKILNYGNVNTACCIRCRPARRTNTDPHERPKTVTPEDLKQILDSHALWLDEKPGGVRASLIGADLRGANLAGATLAGANLIFADLQYADLTNAKLSGADLTGSKQAYAALAGATLTHTKGLKP